MKKALFRVRFSATDLYATCSGGVPLAVASLGFRFVTDQATNVGARFIVPFLHYMFRPLLVAIFRWFVTQKI
jgi:hypothetical protein